MKITLLFIILCLPAFAIAQQQDSLKTQAAGVTIVSGNVTDAVSGAPLPLITVNFTGTAHKATSDKNGSYRLSANGSFSEVTFSYVGYLPVTRLIKPGQANEISVKLKRSQTQLKEVTITSGKKQKYRNKGNPAVELIQQVVDHKKENRMESSGYLQYDQYERIGLNLYHLSPKFLNGHFFSQFKFMLDTTQQINGQKQTILPVFFSEKLYQHYYRKTPEKSIEILTAQKQMNIIKFIDTAGLDIYLNRLYGNNIDIYDNNIFIITNQFLSPIADHAPEFYKFFIIDTIQADGKKFVELNFTPRNKGDLLFEGKLVITLDGHYAVASCELNINKQININFLRSLAIRLDFEKYPAGRYYLKKSDVKADFGILKNRGMDINGERTVFYNNYKLDAPKPAEFYQGKSLQVLANPSQGDTTYWQQHRTDTLAGQQAKIYANVNKLQSMRSFKRATWIASTLTGGYANFGPFEEGPIGESFLYDNQEGLRMQLGGRTRPEFSKTVYLEGYLAYGTKDNQSKYNLTTYFALNKTPFYRYPNDYFKVSYQYDVDVPGKNFAINNSQAALTSFHTGATDYWIYSKMLTVAYVKEFENHFSYNVAFRNWDQQAAGTLVFQLNDANNTVVHNLTTSEFDLGLRYAPHEQILQGTQYRRTIYSKYPIFNLQINHSFKGILNGSYDYTKIVANIYKRFYFSQLGYSDITVIGGYIGGKVPFPLLNITPANQSFAYDANAYNLMDYLEFVNDHYAGINFTQNFNGFFLNKIPLIEHLKWREYLTAKILFGGLRNENNPAYSKDLYQFPIAANGANGTYALGNTPYIEAGAGIGNIFKILRFDVIRRFDYLNHPGISPYGVKFTLSPDF